MQILTQMFQLKFEQNIDRVMFHAFPPSCAVLSAILRDEYLTSAVRTKDGDKAGSNQTLVRDLVHFNLDLTPNSLKFLTSKMADSDPLDMYVSIPAPSESSIIRNFLRKAILKLQDHLSQLDRCKILDQRHMRCSRRSKSTNQRIATVVKKTCAGQGCGFKPTTVVIR